MFASTTFTNYKFLEDGTFKWIGDDTSYSTSAGRYYLYDFTCFDIIRQQRKYFSCIEGYDNWRFTCLSWDDTNKTVTVQVKFCTLTESVTRKNRKHRRTKS